MVTLKRLPGLAAFSQISDEVPPPGWRLTGQAPQNAELYQRCHEMGDVVAAGLG